MKRMCVLLLVFVSLINANAQKNYPILSLDDCRTMCLINDEPIMCVIEASNNQNQLVFYDLTERKKMQSFESDLPNNPVAYLLPCDGGLIYLLTIQPTEGNVKPMLDALYSFSYKKDKLAKVYQFDNTFAMPKAATMVGEKLVLSTSVFSKPPIIFDVRTKQFESFSTNKNLRLVCSSDSHNAYVVLDFSEFNEDDTAPVYVIKLDGTMSEKVGMFDSRMVMSTEKSENRMPGFSITNADYNWIIQAYNTSGFPHSGFSIATRSGLAEHYSALGNLTDVKKLIAANASFLVAEGNGKLFVYNTQTPLTKKLQTLSAEDMSAVTAFFKEQAIYIKTPIQSAALSKVFGAKFYNVTERIQSDEYSYHESHFTVISKEEVYSVLKDKGDLCSKIDPSFKLTDEGDAAVFQDALNAIYPPDTFSKKHIQHYQNDEYWYFVRDESFGDKKGFIVQLDDSNSISNITFANKL